MSETVVRDSTSRALTLALAVAFVCGLLVSVVAVSLRPIQRANVEAERIAQLELVLTALSGIGRAQSIESLEQRMVELDSGRFDDSIDGASFDAARAAASPTTSVSIPEEQDLAGLRRRAKHAQVYLVRGADERIDLIILPVSGRGYQSTLHAWLVMDGDSCASVCARPAVAIATMQPTRSMAFPVRPAPCRASMACCVSGSESSATPPFYSAYARSDPDVG